MTSMAANPYKKLTVIVCLLATLPLAAQVRPGTVRVTVADPSGAALSNARAMLNNVASHYEESATAGEDGGILFDNVPPGQCSLAIEASGFEVAKKDLSIQSDAHLVLNISMRLARSKALV